MKKVKSFVISLLIWLVIVGGLYYVMLPAVNIHSRAFWCFVIFVMLLPAAVIILVRGMACGDSKSGMQWGGRVALAGIGLFAAMVVISIFASPMFHASRYAGILQVEDYDFTEDIDEANAITKVALMDTDSARILGNRKIGSLSQVVSQFNVDEEYSQIDFQTAPMKVAPLEYAGFFKYMGNKSSGVPGYVKVDPVGQKADYVELEQGMKYIPSSYFGKDLKRHLRMKYPTAVLENIHFEIDEAGNPYYVASVMKYTIGLFGGKTVAGAVICDPVSGDCQYYDAKDVPVWIDNVFYGDLLVAQYNWYGKLSNGYLNSIFGKKGCKKCTETVYAAEASEDDDEEDGTAPDYGYISKDGDIWIYTGVTSVNDDASNIGFIMVNERTGEAHFFTIAGADESSAMNAAEGEVQEKGYQASFPSLINVDGTATYVMVLKDANGIVKLYAMVNVEQYNIVATAANLNDCFEKYKAKVNGGVYVENENGGEDDGEPQEDSREVFSARIVISMIQYVEIDGNTYVYLTDEQNNIYRRKFAEDPQIIFLKQGDVCGVDYSEGANGVRDIKGMEHMTE